MSIKPILFNTEMVRAILDGRKTATRRVIKYETAPVLYDEEQRPRIEPFNAHMMSFRWTGSKTVGGFELKMPYYKGQRLYVRETWLIAGNEYYYRADFDSDYLDPCETLSGGFPEACIYHPSCDGCMRGPTRLIWSPSIHMPKEAARIWLKVTDVRVERLQDGFKEQDELLKEGMRGGDPWEDLDAFIRLWNSTIPKKDLDIYGWEASPWAWVIGFERTVKPDENMGRRAAREMR